MYLVFNPIETCYNNTSITLKISDAVNDQRAVYINGILSHHVTEDKITTLITDAGQNLWSDNPAAGAKLGRQLYDLLNRGTGMLQEIIGSARDAETHAHLYLQTPYELTHLPFELLNDGGFVLLRDDIHVIRLTENRGGRSQVTPKKTPLNMLFMACSPTDAHDKYALNFEKEEELIFGAVGNYNIDMRIEDTGSLEGLKQANIAGGGFDIIHITGHAAIDRVLGPVLYMEDDIGKTQKVAPCMLWDAIKDHKPRILFLSGCSTCRADDKANTESFACQMALKGIRWVLGWGLPVSAAGATIVSGEVYRCLSIGKGIDFAIRSARRLLEGQYHPWPLLRLFGDASPIVPLVVEGKLAHVNHVRLRHKTLQGSNVRVLESGFVGRRRYVQRGVSVLRGKTGKCGLLVRGPAGIGKSCLVGKLIERFAGKELIVFHGVVNAGDVILKLRKLLDRLGKKDALAILKSGDEYEEKIKDLFRTVFRAEVSAIIYFDDFEQNLERHGNNYYVKPETIELVRPFLEAVEWTEGNSYVVITSRYPFILEQDGENLSTAKLFDLALMSFYGADLNKKAKDLESVAKSKHAELYLKYGGGNPRLLEWLNVIARDEDKYDLAVIEAQLKLKQAEFIHEYLADVIAATEGEAFHRFIREAAVYREPVDATAFEGFGSVELLNTGVDLTLVEREVR
ncbi:MAG: CHAT domain-containing protein [Magnetococcales bacterium]|nr:CHAT domain-containing protein [Nitrospirota bacterium]